MDPTDGEFLPQEQRSRGKFTKEDAIYGLWAVHDDDVVDTEKQEERHAPIGFVSAKTSNEPTTTTEKKEKTSRTAVASAPVWANWDYSGPSVPSAEQEPDKPPVQEIKDEDVSSAMGFVGFGSQPVARKRAREEAAEADAVREFADMERHTRGIGSKLMAKMGFKGKLGRREQGLSKPIEVRVRPKNLGLAAAGSERTGDAQDEFDRLAKIARGEILEEEEEEVEETPGWRKGMNNIDRAIDRPSRPRPKVTYKDKSDVPQATTQIVDMTGPRTRVVEAKDISNVDAKRAEYVGGRRNLPELHYNTSLLVEMANNEVERVSKKSSFERGQLDGLNRDLERNKKIFEDARDRRMRVEQVAGIVGKLASRASSDPMSLDELHDVFWAIKGKYSSEWTSLNLSSLAIPLVFPKFMALSQAWRPLIPGDSAGSSLVHQLDKWHAILTCDDDSSVFAALVRDTLLPPLRTAVTNQWDVHDSDALVSVCSSIVDTSLPTYVTDHIYDHLIIPRLVQAVDDWSPRHDPVPIHTWLHPWLPLLSDKLRVCYPVIRNKIATAIKVWHPSDDSARIIIEPWKTVFRGDEWNAFMNRCIVPRLTALIKREFKIDPRSQDLRPIKWVLSWRDLVRRSDVVAIFTKEFFPQFHAVLFSWLRQKPDYSEVIKWYMGWKQQFPIDWVESEPSVRTQFNLALDMMNQALKSVDGVEMPVAPMVPKVRSDAVFADISQTGVLASHTKPDKQFKDTVEEAAQEYHLDFLPINRTIDGHTLFKLGKVVVYIDKSPHTGDPCLFLNERGKWIPVALEEIVKM